MARMGAEKKHPHDRFFKVLMGYALAVKALLRERLPKELAAQLGDGVARLVDGSFVDGGLGEHLADRLFEVRTKAAEAFFCLLEHKSAPDRSAPLQFLEYVTYAWKRSTRERKDDRLPPIIPVVVYHGAVPWNVPPMFSQMVRETPRLGVKPVDFQMVVVDVGAIEDGALSTDPTLRAGLMALKYATRESRQRGKLGAVLAALKQAPWLVPTGLTYILTTYRRVDRATVLKEVRRVMPEYEEEMLSMAAREWMAEGMAKGVAKGIAKGIAEGRAKALLVVLKERFGSVARETRNRVKAASAQEVDRWLKRALSAKSVDKVFGPPH